MINLLLVLLIKTFLTLSTITCRDAGRSKALGLRVVMGWGIICPHRLVGMGLTNLPKFCTPGIPSLVPASLTCKLFKVHKL